MSYDNVQLNTPSTESAGVRAIRDARRKVFERIESTSKELGCVAAHYGTQIASYQAELNQLNASLAALQPATSFADQACGTTQAPSAHNRYNK